jgi:hypothetical protein
MGKGTTPKYLGTGFSVAHGSSKSMLILDGSKLGRSPATHLLVLGSVSPQFAIDLNEQLYAKLRKYYPKFVKPEELFQKAISSLKVPRTHEIVPLQTELDSISELRLKTIPGGQTLEEKKLIVQRAWIGIEPLELIYNNRPRDLENEYGWRSPSRQLDVLSISEKGFKAQHSRGVRNYLWDKVERVALLNGDASHLAPELCIEIAIPYEPGAPEWRSDFLVTEVHELLSDYEFGSVEDKVRRPSMASQLKRTWG